MIKIFFNYSSQEEDVKMMTNLCLHFAVLKDKLLLWHKGKIFPGDVVKKALEENLNDSEATVHLLSIAYENEENCTDILQQSLQQHKKNIPVLLSSFDWESDARLLQLKEVILPPDHQPIDLHPNQNMIYTEIVKSVRKELLGDDRKINFNDRGYYGALGGITLAAGFFAAWWANGLFGSLLIALLVFLLFAAASLFVLRKIIFPTSVSTSKF